ncbi:MAG: hypothetical protein AB7U20_22080 [Planctomycetaceae bacterium]
MTSTHGAFPVVVSGLALLLLAVAGLAVSSKDRTSAPMPVADGLIENLQTVSASVVSGGEPQGVPAFAALQRRGIHTIVSVDGARPDVATATRFGLRYVHTPIGYDGLPDDALRMLTKVMQECDRPVFVHCHHGKHRGPAAAAVCAIIAHELDCSGGLELLEHTGTSRDYAGLWRDVAAFAPIPPDTPLPPLVEVAEPPPLVDVMVQIDKCFERLTGIVEAQQRTHWSNTEADRLAPRAVELASNLHELFREAARLELGGMDADMHGQMLSAEQAARTVADAAHNCPIALPALMAQLRENCQSCHQRHRN